MTKKEKIKYVLKFFENKYGNLKTELNYETEFQLMIAVILSAQCTDARVNIVTKELFKVVKQPIDIVNMDIETLERYIKSAGFYHNKAKILKKVLDNFMKIITVLYHIIWMNYLNWQV